MNRLKFRAYNNATNSYVECNNDEELFLSAYGELFCYDKQTGRMTGGFHCDIEQCTGEKDKNNNLIYGGDRVQKDDYIGTVKFGTYSKNDCGGKDAILGFYIEWDNAPLWRKDFNYWVREGIEIIGNIHEQK